MLRRMSAAGRIWKGRYRQKGLSVSTDEEILGTVKLFHGPAVAMETHLCYEIGTRPEEDDDEQQAYAKSVVTPSQLARCRRQSFSCW